MWQILKSSTITNVKSRSTAVFRSTISRYLVAFTAIGVGLSTVAWYHGEPAPEPRHSIALGESTVLESRLLFAGDVNWDRRMHDWAQTDVLKEAYPFSRLGEFRRDEYDAWIANLECPTVAGVEHPVGYVPDLSEFNCDPDYLPEAARWFDIFSLANNHMHNQNGESGLAATRQALDANGIQYFGSFNPDAKKEICDVVSIPTRLVLDGRQQKSDIPIALCGFNGVRNTISDDSIATLRNYAEFMPVIALPHKGSEYQNIADEKRRSLYRKMIDNGADVVIGNHPHTVQPTEVYNGKLIAYSLGNFISDQQFNQEVTQSAAVDVVMRIDRDSITDDQLRSWTQLGARCAVFQDDCLARARMEGLQRMPVHFSFDIVGVDTRGHISKPATLATYNAILDRLDWQNTRKYLV